MLKEKTQYQRTVWAEVDLSAIKHNVSVVRERVGSETLIMAVVKANAYGHGAVPVSKAMVEAGVDHLGVALLEEAEELRAAGLQVPIQILAEVPSAGAERLVSGGFVATVCSQGGAEALAEAAKKLGTKAVVHIKVDTGMNRIGLPTDQTVEFINQLLKQDGLQVEGVFTHFASADRPDVTLTNRQIDRFKKVTDALETKGIKLIRHAANSAGIFLFPESHFDMVRAGISLYGLHPSAATRPIADLRPALSLKSLVSFFKRLPEGEGVSYSHTHRTSRPTNIATVPVGYGDGYPRLLSNRSDVLIKGNRCRVVGNICMDQLMVDVGETSVETEDEVVLIGTQQSEEVSADEIARLLGTINYEVTCMLNRRIPRVYTT